MPLLPSVAKEPPYRIAIGAGCSLGIAAVVAGLAASSPRPVTVDAPIALPAVATPSPVLPLAMTPQPSAPPSPDVHSNQLMFVFEAGGATYLRLADVRSLEEEGDELPVPRHGKFRLSNDNYIDAAIAPVADRSVPLMHLVWKDRKVKVDNRCEASVIGFAVVARVVGDPGWANLEKWSAAGIMKAGKKMLVAKLDGCSGSFARDATLPDIVRPTQLHDPALEEAARAALIASAPARETQREWDEQWSPADGKVRPWHKEATMTTEVLRHPHTGVTFVSVQGRVQGGCGAPQANVWGLFRVDGGTLVPVQLRKLDDLETIDALIDVDDDGDFEMLGKPWLPYGMQLIRADGKPLEALSVPFLGCPC